jgi:hypothetical protein
MSFETILIFRSLSTKLPALCVEVRMDLVTLQGLIEPDLTLHGGSPSVEHSAFAKVKTDLCI